MKTVSWELSFTMMSSSLCWISLRCYRNLIQNDTLESFPKNIEQCRILFAEDQIFFRQLVVQYFKSYGIKNTTVCKNGEEALQTLIGKPDSFDIVISDIEMPVMDGYQLVSTIKSDPRLREIPVMALTSLDSEESVKKGMDAGFDAYEVKLDKDRVLHKISELYKRVKK